MEKYIIKVGDRYWGGWKWDKAGKSKIPVLVDRADAQVIDCHYMFIKDLLIECLGFDRYKEIQLMVTQ